MYIADAALLILSLGSGLYYLYFCFDCWAREKRLPLATKYDDLETRIELKNSHFSELQQQVVDLVAKKAEQGHMQAALDILTNDIRDHKEQLLSLESERSRQESLRQQIAEELQHYNDIVAKKDKVTEEHDQLQRTCGQLQSDQDRLKEHQASISEKIAELTANRDALHSANTELLIKQRDLQATVEDLEKQSAVVQGQLSQLKEHQASISEKIVELTSDRDALHASNTELLTKQRDLQAIVGNLEEHQASISEKIVELTSNRDALHSSNTELFNKQRDLQPIVENLEKQKAFVQGQLSQTQSELEKIQQEHEQLTISVGKLKYECELFEFKKELHQCEVESNSANTVEDLKKAVFPNRAIHEDMNEIDALEGVSKHLKNMGLTYSKRTLYSFHTSLKINDISPLVVLAGISGTGKSQLPSRYAEAMGIHFLSMAVQPRWDSPQDLLGFYNHLEKKYKPTELTRTLIQMELFNRDLWPDCSFLDDQMVLALFDEMNLARIEYYFSEFLSKLEMRRNINPSHRNSRSPAEIVLEAGPSVAWRIYVANNVLFVGTMNEDESTQALSDKIVDRANILRFGKPNKMKSNKAKVDNHERKALSFANWQNWLHNDHSEVVRQHNLDEKIERLNEAMACVGRPFGHRTAEAIRAYISNYPRNKDGVQVNEALADQIEQRIMPKLRNIACREASFEKAATHIEAVIEETQDKDLLNAFKKSADADCFEWHGIERR